MKKTPQEDSPEEDFPKEDLPFHMGKGKDPAGTFAVLPFKNFKRLEIDFLQDLERKTNLALTISALRSGSTTLTNAMSSNDTQVMIECLESLGFKIFLDKKHRTITVDGHCEKVQKEKDDPIKLCVKDSKTVAWFLPTLLALRKSGKYFLDGSVAMRKRSMKGLLEALQKLGCEFAWENKEWHLPFTIVPHGIKADSVSVADSSDSHRILSALLLIAPCIAKNGRPFLVELLGKEVFPSLVNMTCRMINEFGGGVGLCPITTNKLVCIGNYYAGGHFSYPLSYNGELVPCCMMLPFVHRGLKVRFLGVSFDCELQGCTKFGSERPAPFHNVLSIERILSQNGCDDGIEVSISTPQYGFETDGFEIDFSMISSIFLPLVAVSPLLKSPLKITNMRHMGECETDYVATVVAELAKIVGKENVVLKGDSLTVYPCGLEAIKARADACPDGVISIKTDDDQHMARSFAVLGTYDLRDDGSTWLSICSTERSRNALLDFLVRLGVKDRAKNGADKGSLQT